jgi:hypothetical protein
MLDSWLSNLAPAEVPGRWDGPSNCKRPVLIHPLGWLEPGIDVAFSVLCSIDWHRVNGLCADSEIPSLEVESMGIDVDLLLDCFLAVTVFF